jgi:hypothetical protein
MDSGLWVVGCLLETGCDVIGGRGWGLGKEQ